MTAVVSQPLLVPSFAQDGIAFLNDSPSEARKRRREILVTQRSSFGSSSSDESSCSSSHDGTKRPKLEVLDKGMKHAEKKPQMKYNPEIPMTREEAAAWRREQRRKRNRESAAASRQRQRDRINELETELEEWKEKYETVVSKIKAHEEGRNYISESAELILLRTTRSETPPPQEAKTVTPRSSPTSTTFLSFADKVMVKNEDSDVEEEVGFEPSKMISRQA
ncbi:hypothetical protein FisN_4Lh033 [Fistulifera solaris]|uniref:BZIP domain-containing protein n=1 Tax=Fistulifera solaris TaxID=1519565 RepID=A0A1Z5KD89_FISSO|nr:hypothetical protein FisN_4Lh033 [Fistulifera solaris]|eukprot:GAX24264.1 hypothetical protein FisN_4Lh033 [Fistulifera solaris]